MDEVIADTLGELLVRYNRDFGTAFEKSELVGRRFWETVPVEHKPQIY